MTLQKQLVTLPITGGQNEKVDTRVAVTPLALTNCRYTKTGSLSKRPGSTCIARFNDQWGIATGTPNSPELLCAFGDHLVRVGGGAVYSVAPVTSKDTIFRGYAAEAVARRRVVADSVYACGDMALGTYQGRPVYVTVYEARTSSSALVIAADIIDVATGAFIYRRYVLDATAGSYNPKVVVSNGYAVFVWRNGTNIIAYRISLSTLAGSGPTTLSTTHPAGMTDQGIFDICAVSDTLYLIHRNSGASNRVTVKPITISTMTAGAGISLGGADDNIYCVAIEAYTGEYVHILYLTTSAGTCTPKGARIDLSVTAVQSGPWSFTTHADSGAGAQSIYGGIARYASSYRYYVWSTPTGMNWTQRDASGSSVANYTRQGVVPISDPFVVYPFSTPYIVCTTMYGRDSADGLSAFLSGDAIVMNLSDSGGIGRVAGVFAHRQIDRNQYTVSARGPCGTGNVAVSDSEPTVAVGVLTGIVRDGYSGAYLGGYKFTFEAATLTFDTNTGLTYSNKPTAAVSGNVLVHSGGSPFVLDGQVVTECGFDHGPSFEATSQTTGGSLTQLATYQFVTTYAWYDANGNLHRSEPSRISRVALTGTNCKASLIVRPMHVTNRANIGTTFSHNAAPVWIELWRTAANGSTYYLDQREKSDINGSSVTMSSTQADSTLTVQEVLGTIQTDPSVPYVLPAYTPPSAACVARIRDRIWLTDTDDGTAWFSDVLTQGEAPRFNPSWVVPPPPSGRWVAAGQLDEKIILFEADAVWMLFGDGPDSTNTGSFSAIQCVSSDIGCTDGRGIAATSDGLYFMSRDGLALLTRSLQVVRISQGVEDTMGSYDVRAAVNVPDLSETRFVIGSTQTRKAVVYDAHHGNPQQPVWYVYSYANPAGSSTAEIASACFWDGAFTWITTDGYVYQDSTDYLDTSNSSSTWVTMQVESSNWNAGVLQGWMSVFAAGILAERKTDHDLAVDVYQDWSSSGFTRTWTRAEIAALPREQVMVLPPTQPCQAVRVKFSDATPTGGTVGTGEGARLAGITLEVGARGGMVPMSVGARK